MQVLNDNNNQQKLLLVSRLFRLEQPLMLQKNRHKESLLDCFLHFGPQHHRDVTCKRLICSFLTKLAAKCCHIVKTFGRSFDTKNIICFISQVSAHVVSRYVLMLLFSILFQLQTSSSPPPFTSCESRRINWTRSSVHRLQSELRFPDSGDHVAAGLAGNGGADKGPAADALQQRINLHSDGGHTDNPHMWVACCW